MGEEAHHAQPVVDRHGEQLARGGQRLAVVQRKGARPGLEATARDVHEDGERLRDGRRAAPDVEGEAVLAHRVRVEQGAFERSEEHTSELQSLMRRSYAVFCLKKKKTN